jgi:hypothetical protein
MEFAPMPPVRLTDEQMSAVLAASHPLPRHARSAFLAACAQELAQLPELGDGAVHRTIMKVQREFFDPPQLDRGVASKYA